MTKKGRQKFSALKREMGIFSGISQPRLFAR